MNNLVPADGGIRFGEVIPPQATVRVVGVTNPLVTAARGHRIDRHLMAGLTIAEMLDDALEDRPGVRSGPLMVAIDGNPIEKRNWHRVRAKAGTTVTFIPRLGDNTIIRSALAIVVAVAAVVITGPAGLGWGSALASALSITSTVGIALTTAAVSAGIVSDGPVALDALFREGCRGQALGTMLPHETRSWFPPTGTAC